MINKSHHSSVIISLSRHKVDLALGDLLYLKDESRTHSSEYSTPLSQRSVLSRRSQDSQCIGLLLVLQRPRFARNYGHDAPAGASLKVNNAKIHAEVPEVKVLYQPRKNSTSPVVILLIIPPHSALACSATKTFNCSVAVTLMSATLGNLLGSSPRTSFISTGICHFSTIIQLVMATKRSDVSSQGDRLLTVSPLDGMYLFLFWSSINRCFNVVETATMRPLSIAAILETA
jgi:hypothetical protein